MGYLIANNLAAIISFIGTIVVVFISCRNNKKSLKQQKEIAEKNIHANIISEARIAWIQEVRKLMADFIKKSKRFLFYYGEYLDLIGTKEEEIKKREINAKLMDIESLEYLLLLYFSDNKGNEEIRDAIENVIKYLNNLINKYSNKKIQTTSKYEFEDKTITDLLRISTNYFKTEWDRAKNFE